MIDRKPDGSDKVIVGLSGGVDSAVAAYLLKKAGYDVIGVTLRVWQTEDGTESRCCEIDDARGIANKLKIPFYPVNCIPEFQKRVVDPFVCDYLHGLTPNPCVLCNRYVKWEKLLYYAKVIGAKYVATGHYASVVKLANGRYTVKRALHAEKDQTYMLYRLTQQQLAATLMPLADLSKAEVRQIAKGAGLFVASKPDSQEVCFVTNGSYADFIAVSAAPGAFPEGFFVDESGKLLGKHKGIARYTVGQRKGLGLSLGYPAYVKEIRPDRNEVVISGEGALYSRELLCGDVNFLSVPGLKQNETIPCAVKIRYRHNAVAAKIEGGENGLVKITFEEPVRAATPGQSAVFYDKNGCVIGGGIICQVLKSTRLL